MIVEINQFLHFLIIILEIFFCEILMIFCEIRVEILGDHWGIDAYSYFFGGQLDDWTRRLKIWSFYRIFGILRFFCIHSGNFCVKTSENSDFLVFLEDFEIKKKFLMAIFVKNLGNWEFSVLLKILEWKKRIILSRNSCCKLKNWEFLVLKIF